MRLSLLFSCMMHDRSANRYFLHLNHNPLMSATHRGRSNTVIKLCLSFSLSHSLSHTHMGARVHTKTQKIATCINHRKPIGLRSTGTHASAVYRLLNSHYSLLPRGSPEGQHKNNEPLWFTYGHRRGASDRCLCMEHRAPGPMITPLSPSIAKQPLGAITSTCCPKEQCPCSPNKRSQLRESHTELSPLWGSDL